ncbi:MAG: hypothetical protein JWN34_27, partial [Bryobacterales bacterium]|nr:hypothetical protein [Bryobacterales bacterium]
MLNFINKGETVTVTAPYTVVSGAGVLVGRLFGVAADDIASGSIGEIVTRGVFELAKGAATF